MKRISALIAVICLCAAGAMAQFRAAGVAGVNINSLSFSQDLVPVDNAVGFHAGVLGELMFPGIGFGLDLGLLYNQAGAKVDLGSKEVWSSLGYGNERSYLHYVQIPLHLRFKWTRMSGLEEYVAPFVYGGPELNILVAHNKCKAYDYSGAEIGLTAGLGVEVMRDWQVSASYTWGMTNALETKLLDGFGARNRQWTVRVAYFFKH
ncbi:MAG: PorT family protein [Muribaculaceae bacterium]|nr:PorT family protein [Muribaculaceae bacterium]